MADVKLFQEQWLTTKREERSFMNISPAELDKYMAKLLFYFFCVSSNKRITTWLALYQRLYQPPRSLLIQGLGQGLVQALIQSPPCDIPTSL